MPLTLDEWLARLERQHPVTIDLTLDRISRVYAALSLPAIAPVLISVAGTNGKGSCVRTLEDYVVRSGRQVGAYTSPHLQHYNERIRINGLPASDDEICEAFEKVEHARGEVSLTYFEVGTLAALIIMARHNLDIAILEVGLGGRFDAVNVIDADIAVITSIDLDHQAWLGDTREQIALEKIGIARSGKPVICAEPEPPANMVSELQARGCPVLYLGKDFGYQQAEDGTLSVELSAGVEQHLKLEHLPRPGLPLPSVAAALQTALYLDGKLDKQIVAAMMNSLFLGGRFERRDLHGRVLILDVAHNPAAASLLAENIRQSIQRASDEVSVSVVAAIMADKDVGSFVEALAPVADEWYLPDLETVERALPAARLGDVVYTTGASATILDTVAQAMRIALDRTVPGDFIVVCGSFFTVAAVLNWLERGEQ